MFCTQCGSQNRDGARFCVGCGAPLPAPVAAPAPQQAPPSPWAQQAPPPQQAWQPAEAYMPRAGQGRTSSPLGELLQFAMPAGGLLMLISAFLPWATASFGEYSESASGLDVGARGVFVLLFGLALIGAYLALRFVPSLWAIPNLRVVVVIGLGLILLATIIILITVFTDVGDTEGMLSIGFGVFVAIAGAVLGALGAVWVWLKS
jgi:hypothetical protein